MYDGGTWKDAFDNIYAIEDIFRDVKALDDGSYVFVGKSRDSTGMQGFLLIKLSNTGSVIWKKFLRTGGAGACSIILAKNGDLLIGGQKGSAPFMMRADSLGNIKWATWYYDSISKQDILVHSATINCLRETRSGTIICAAGDVYPDNNGLSLKNYAAFLEFDSTGKVIRTREWNNVTGYNIAGFDIEETKDGHYLLSGNEAVFYLDSVARPVWQKAYSYQLTSVGSEIATICRAKVLQGNIPMVAGKVYEGNCWTKYQHLYYDAWWSPINYSDGSYKAWDTAGKQGGDDVLYDFTQLIDGKLVFVGDNANSQMGDIWAVVTDSTGKNLLWEKQFRIPYRTEDGRAPTAYSVCATVDSGFTVAGEYACTDQNGGRNAFAAHFIPTTGASIAHLSHLAMKSFSNTYKIIGTKIVFPLKSYSHVPECISIYTVDGKRVMYYLVTDKRKSADSFELDFSGVTKGVYLYVIKTEHSIYSGSIIVGK